MLNHTPPIRRLLQSMHSAKYIMQRLEEHGGHTKKSLHSTFVLLYFVSGQQLANGNTLLWFSDDNVADVTTWGLDCGRWQSNFLAQALPTLDACLGRTYSEFGAISATMLATSTDELPAVIETALQPLTQEMAAFGEQISLSVKEFARLLLRFYYAYHCTALQAWYQLLTDTFFCQSMHEDRGCLFVLSTWDEHGFGLWLQRAWMAEYQLSQHIQRLLSCSQAHDEPPAIASLENQQQQAVNTAMRHNFTIITGGPGTGKTYTVGQLVKHLLSSNPALSLALVAPTGKAANRMYTALSVAVGEDFTALPEPMTIHRLLGITKNLGTPYYNANNPLPYALIIVDETSMLGAELGAKLLASVADGARLILLGDANQLAAVEAGAVLADLCRLPMLAPYHVKLTKSQRFTNDSIVGKLATLVQTEDIADKYAHIQTLSHPNLRHYPLDNAAIDKVYSALIAPYEAYFSLCQTLKDAQNIDEQLPKLFATLNTYRILTASHLGAVGDIAINAAVTKAHLKQQGLYRAKPLTWYHGRVVMITQNNYALGLFNGDVGVCLYRRSQTYARATDFWVYFEGKAEPVSVALLSETMITTAYAMTIHKSQGSEFTEVAICFDDSNSRLLGRELLYTAITRAKVHLGLFASQHALTVALTEATVRHTGLPHLFD